MTHKPDLAALVGSRICHDLISPVGAISNGMELIELAGTASTPELSLINDSVANANAKIRFFRVAFGQASEDQQVGEHEILTMLDNVSIGSRMMADWTVQGPVERIDLRLTFLAILCFETSLPFGGVVDIQRSGKAWKITGSGDKMRIEDSLWDALDTGNIPETLSPNQVQFGLLPRMAQAAGRSLKTSRTETQLDLSF